MPESDATPRFNFAGLLADAQAAFRSDYDDVLRRTARRRTRTRVTFATVACLAALGLTGFAVLPGRSGSTPSPEVSGSAHPSATNPIGPTPSYLPTPGPSTSANAFVNYTTRLMEAGDLNHLYALRGRCPDQGHCGYTLFASTDRGGTWRSFATPPLTGETFMDLTVIAPRTLLITSWHGGPIYRVTTDGGATWRRVAATDVDHVPTGWRAVPCPSSNAGCRLLVADPGTGDLGLLANANTPVFGQFALRAVVVADGIWIRGEVGGQEFVAVSRDRGRTWTRQAFADPVIALASAGGDVAYAFTLGAGRVSCYRTGDGGRTWHDTGARLAVGQSTVAATVRPDGTVTVQVGQPGGTGTPVRYLGSSQGTGFAKVPLAPGPLALPVPGGYAQRAYDGGVWLSTDDVTWAYVGPPANS